EQYRFTPSRNDGQTDLYIPFAMLGINQPQANDLRLLAFATDPVAMRVWSVMPAANPVSSPRVVEDSVFAGAVQTFAFTQFYYFRKLADDICPNDGPADERKADTDLAFTVRSQPDGTAYNFIGDNL